MNATKYRPLFASALAQRVLEPGDAVLEIGGADGEHTRIYADRVGPSGHVLTVDPHRAHVAALRALAQPWVSVCAGAVGAAVGRSVLHVNAAYPKCSSLYASNVFDRGESYEVPVTTVDALLLAMPRTPQLIQVDAQGAEASIVRGSVRALRLPIVWVLELWRDGLKEAGATVADVLSPFIVSGYVPHTVALEPVSWATIIGTANRRRGRAHCDVVLLPREMAA